MNKSEMIDAIARHADISKAAAGRALDDPVMALTEHLRERVLVPATQRARVTVIDTPPLSAVADAAAIAANPNAKQPLAVAEKARAARAKLPSTAEMKKKYGDAKMRRFLAYELNRYLVGRAFDDFGVDAFERLHLEVVAAARDGEARPGRCCDLELGHSRSPSRSSAG